jgi:Family of unknown function (DUF5343)
LPDKHPYSPSPGGITAAIGQFRNSFPPTVNAETLRSLAIAPKNESYVINTLRFLGAIDKDGKQIEKAVSVFYQSDLDFQKGFEELIKTAYADLFTLHKDNTWNLPTDKLIAFFRSKDKTTGLVGKLQAATFQLLASFAGHGTVPEPVTPKVSKGKVPKAKAEKKIIQSGSGQPEGERSKDQRDVGLTVRIEVNLPPSGDQETYDKIFRSIRENLLNGK